VTAQVNPAAGVFVGRVRELDELTALLETSRMITLAGTGGVGKTRLAWELAVRAADRFSDRVYRVELASVAHPELVPAVIGDAIGVVVDDDQSVDAIASILTDRKALLVVDNCEHVVDSCAILLEALLRRCGGLVVLATSREALNLPGETVYRLGGLALTTVPGSPAVAAEPALDSDAVALFLARAPGPGPVGTLAPRDAAALTAICVRLEGLPLAIELVAAMAGTTPMPELARRLDDRLLTLTGGAVAQPDRHSSLSAALEWSYDLLDPVEQAVFRRLSVFAGGFELESAERVCADAEVSSEAVLGAILRLEAKSLITATPSESLLAPPLRLLETTRLYGREKLAVHGEETATYHRLMDYLMSAALPLLEQAELRAEPTSRIVREHENLGHVLEAVDWGTDERQLMIAAAFGLARRLRGHTRQARALLTRALRDTDPDSRYRTVALAQASRLAFDAGHQNAALRMIERAVDLERRHDRPAVLSQLLSLYGREMGWIGDAMAEVAIMQECLKVSTDAGDDLAIAMCRHNLAGSVMTFGDLDAAASLIDEALPVVLADGSPRLVSAVVDTAGQVALHRGDLGQASRHFAKALQVGATPPVSLIHPIENLAVVATRTGRVERGLRLLGFVMAIRERVGLRFNQRENADLAVVLDQARRELPPARARAAMDAGRRMSVAEAVAYAVADSWSDPPTPLSSREWQVACLVAEGMSNQQIAGRLGTSVRTVEAQVRSVRHKLDVRSRAQVAAWTAQRIEGSLFGGVQ
jgi:predicted ATPase/DNA-binding CsgD family transcriptional regulator